MYTKKQLRHAFQCGVKVKENLLSRKINKKPFNLEEQFEYFLDKVLIKDNPVSSIDIEYLLEKYSNENIDDKLWNKKQRYATKTELVKFSKYFLQNDVETDNEQPHLNDEDVPNINYNCKCGLCISCTF